MSWLYYCTGEEKRLTYARKNHVPIEDDPMSAGLPSYIIQEEFNRFEGFWWQPKTECITAFTGLTLPISYYNRSRCCEGRENIPNNV